MSDIASAGLELPYHLQVLWHHPAGGTFNINLVIEGFSFSLTMEGKQAKWTGTVNTSALTPATS
jgi:hypothetical protein